MPEKITGKIADKAASKLSEVVRAGVKTSVLGSILLLASCDIPPEWSAKRCEEVHNRAITVMWSHGEYSDIIAANMVKTAHPDKGYIISVKFKDKYGIAQTYVSEKPTSEFSNKEAIHINDTAKRIYISYIAAESARFDLDLGEELEDDPAIFWGKVCIDEGYFSQEDFVRKKLNNSD